ncbi:hypothetical protein V2J09_000430 [Rumex salicifolius]
MGRSSWKKEELGIIIIYAVCFYAFIIHRSLQLSHDYYGMLRGLSPGWLANRYNDVSDGQWRNFRGNLLILTSVFGVFTLIATIMRSTFQLKANGMSIVWLVISLSYLIYLHGACIIFIILIASLNFLLVKIFAGRKYFALALWTFNLLFLFLNRIHEGYSFSLFGQHWSYLDNFRGNFRWHICFNFGIALFLTSLNVLDIFSSLLISLENIYKLTIMFTEFKTTFGHGYISKVQQLHWRDRNRKSLRSTIPSSASIVHTSHYVYVRSITLRMISFGCDYHWAHTDSRFDLEKHIQRCNICKSGRICYLCLQEKSLQTDKYSFSIYLCYLLYAPLYIAGPIVSFNAFASQLDLPQNTYSSKDVGLYGLRWMFGLLLMEAMSHLFYYNAFALSGMWKNLSAVDVFIIGYGLIAIAIVAFMFLPNTVLNFMWLKFLLIWRYFRFCSLINGIEAPENMPKCINNCYNLESFWKIWHASYNKWLVRKLLSWAWLTCIFFIPEMLLKSGARAFKAETAFGKFIFRELSAVAGAVTITCLMIANLVGFVIGPSGMSWLVSRFSDREGLPILGGMLFTFYLGTKVKCRARILLMRNKQGNRKCWPHILPLCCLWNRVKNRTLETPFACSQVLRINVTTTRIRHLMKKLY